MVLIQVVYDGKLHCTAIHEPSGSIIQTTAPKDNMGEGNLFSPTDLFAASTATCIATVLGIYAARKGWNLEGMRINVSKEMSTTPPRRIGSLKTEIWIPGSFTDEEKVQIEKVAHTCPVHLSLHPDIQAPITFHWEKDKG